MTLSAATVCFVARPLVTVGSPVELNITVDRMVFAPDVNCGPHANNLTVVPVLGTYYSDTALGTLFQATYTVTANDGFGDWSCNITLTDLNGNTFSSTNFSVTNECEHRSNKISVRKWFIFVLWDFWEAN